MRLATLLSIQGRKRCHGVLDLSVQPLNTGLGEDYEKRNAELFYESI